MYLWVMLYKGAQLVIMSRLAGVIWRVIYRPGGSLICSKLSYVHPTKMEKACLTVNNYLCITSDNIRLQLSF